MDVVRGPFAGLLVWSAVALAGALPAAAQESPAAGAAAAVPAAVTMAAAPTPAPQTPTGETSASPTGVDQSRPTPAPARRGGSGGERSHLVDLTLTAVKGYGIGSDQLVPPGTLSDNQIVINGLLQVRVLPRLRLYERRENHDDLGGRTFKNKKPSYGGLSLDLEYDTGASYEVSKQLEVAEEFMYRYRVCCPGSGDPLNSTPRIEQGLRTIVTYLAGPMTRIGRPLRLRVDANDVNHHVDKYLAVPAGSPILGKTWVTKLGAYLSLPVYGQTQVVPYVGIEHYSDFYNNAFTPSMTNRSFYGVRIRGSSFASYRAYVKSEHQTNPGGDVPHKVELYLESSFRFHS